ncbi:hypothetical protein [Mycetocola miduiensis]|uniref:Uncharacterized protein n=1 Tax=Mycetocola miduiensis TaxID=995034 RepID=A0A1I4ZWA4_9MICO|nr:hypothetical protein [Mycetocola miduiensis]SFN54363.1 hypothetical protein SAMN05216219_1123 [Mycetocola miduiensis]
MHGSQFRAVIYWTLLVVTIFNVVSAIGGGVAMLVTNGLGMPVASLAGSPFDSFVWPGVILIVVVGGTQALAAVLLLLRRESALLWSAVAALGMLIWIFTETGLIRGWSWLQVVYFATGTAQLVCVLALLGVAAWLPREPLREPVTSAFQVTPRTVTGIRSRSARRASQPRAEQVQARSS